MKMLDNHDTRVRIRKLVAMAAVFIAVAVGGYLLMRTRKTGPPERITIAHSTLPYAALAQIAQVRGFFSEEGLEATPQLYGYGKLALEAVLAGKADFATVAETPVMLAIMNGAPISIVATIQISRKSHAIVARKERGIAKAEDLRGKRIGVTPGTSGDFYLDAFLLALGIPIHEVKVVSLKPEELSPALMRGEVDAVSTWAPFLMQAQKALGGRGITFNDEGVYTLTFNVVTTREWAVANPEKVKRLLKALLRAERFARTDPDEAQRTVAGFNRIDLATVAEMWRYSTFTVTLTHTVLPSFRMYRFSTS